MSLKIMPKNVLPDWVAMLGTQFRLVGPTKQAGKYVYNEINSAEELCLYSLPSVLPPKKYLMPPRENLLNYRLDGSRIEATIEVEPTVIFGLHTCDIHGVMLLDHMFSSGYVDQNYQAHRDNTYLVSIECLAPCTEHSFCRDMGTASAADGYDLHFLDLDDVYIIDVNSRKGARLLEGCRNIFDALPPDVERLNEALKKKWQKFEYRLEFNIVEMSDLLGEMYESDLWDELGARCLGCGMCTNVCPTCYCFDVSDEADLLLQEGKRARRWDSCQVNSFSEVAGGHDFRAKIAARQRHRFMRKGKYQLDACGMVGCVGCGRCATSCLVHITPIGVFNDLFRRNRANAVEEPIL
ncbi:MAG: 4Fe-4S dicluster domain-containing protein [Ardenticatenaceae bacterium]|nr:4Fe-4S dicluster domain-containing protein [Anaerolineales bacterium]MCB8974081.1 4Fe-4S dicluster domain-containing protein [Ardenticatenaceae bacterium]